MRRTALIYVIALLSGLMLYSCKPSDEKLQKAVETALSSTEGITPAVKGGIVTLTGTVDSEEAKAAAEAAAKSVKDIKSVTNNIEVVLPPPPVNPDDTLSNTIKDALSAGGFKDVSITVKDGEVTLTGNVKKKADMTKVVQIANQAKPKKVINQIKVK